MFPPRWFLPYDAIFQLITAAVSLAIALYAFRGHHWVKERTLYALFLAFMLLSLGLFINGMTLTYAYINGVSFVHSSAPLAIADLGFWAYYVTSIVAYSVLILAYALRLRDASLVLAAGAMARAGGAAGGSLVLAGPLLELVLAVLLFVIVVAQMAHLVVKRSKYSVLVTLSFGLLLISHILIMLSSVEDLVYVVGRVFELAGFLALLGLLYGLRGAR